MTDTTYPMPLNGDAGAFAEITIRLGPNFEPGERFVCSRLGGSWRAPFDVGARVRYGVMLGHHAGASGFASMDGVPRGIARDGTFVPKGVKLLEIDMRGQATRALGATRVQQNFNRAEHVS